MSRPFLEKEIMVDDLLPNRPYLSVSCDLFLSFERHYLVFVDRFSSSKIINQFIIIFATTGVSIRIRTDNGSQFSSFKFKQFLKNW